VLSRRERLLAAGRACWQRHPQTIRYLHSIVARLVRSSRLDRFAQSVPKLTFVLDCSIPLPIAMATTGKLLSVPRALPALAASEDAIAAVLGHELAHLRLQHLERRLQPGATRELERMQEREADRVGLDLAASAGYDPFAAIDHMRRTEALALALQRSGKFPAQPRDPVHADLETRTRRLQERIRACGYRAPLQRTPVAPAVKAELRGATGSRP
jgi:predicted Zn-dependent protease